MSSSLPYLEEFQNVFEKKINLWLHKLSPSPLPQEVLYTIRSKGKRIRPFLAFLTYKALGGKDNDIFLLGLALELFHTFCILQDDAMDESFFRRNKKTTFYKWANLSKKQYGAQENFAYGKNVAFLSGDFALVLAYRFFYEIAKKNSRLFFTFQKMAEEVLQGQLLDITFSIKTKVSEKEIINMLALKSGYYTVVRPMQLGALLATPKNFSYALFRFGEPLGIAFQMHDDELSLFGKKTGKGIKEDIREGKKTLLLALTLKKAPSEIKKKMLALLHQDISDEELEFFQEQVRQYGLRAHQEKKEELFKKALQALKKIPFPPSFQKIFVQLSSYLVTREK